MLLVFVELERAQAQQILRALSTKDYRETLEHIRSPDELVKSRTTDMNDTLLPVDLDEIIPWTSESLEENLAPFYEEYEQIMFNREARANHHTIITPKAPRLWSVKQILLDENSDRLYCLEGIVDIRGQETPEGALISLKGLALQ